MEGEEGGKVERGAHGAVSLSTFPPIISSFVRALCSPLGKTLNVRSRWGVEQRFPLAEKAAET
jgi:hypothetical protein